MTAATPNASRLEARELSARGRGGISVLEIRGERALERIQGLARTPRLVPGSMAFVRLRTRAGDLLDEAIVLALDPTCAELHLHGSPALVERVLAELGAVTDPPPAESLEERAEVRLAEAPSEAAARMLLDQVQGALRRELESLLRAGSADVRPRLRALVERGRVARALLEPPAVVLAGPVNAGKSTLFNVLVGRTRALVHPEAGTTRDAVRARVLLGAYAVDLYDTAGERVLDPVSEAHAAEHAGQQWATELARSADLVLELLPPGHVAGAEVEGVRLRRSVRSCTDLRPTHGAEAAAPGLSAVQDPIQAREVVERVFLAALDLPARPWQPGAGVPFEAEWIEALESGLSATGVSTLLERIRAWVSVPPREEQRLGL